MKQKLNIKSVFLSSTIFLFTINIVGLVIFGNNMKLSANTLLASSTFIVLLIRGILACIEKNDELLLLKKHYTNKFFRYNRPTNRQLNDFYIKATIYFAILPFYLPLAAFSSKSVHCLWTVLLLFGTQFVIIGIDIRKMMLQMKERKIKDDIFQKEKEEQEKREELGRWK